MSERLNYADAAPGAYQAMLGIETYVRGCGLERSLLELMKVRASQLNGCAYCLDMHCKDARAAGESEQRLDLLAAWREAPCYSARERAALAWTEALTPLGPRGVPDDVYEEASGLFTAPELGNLAMVVIAINGWNRLAIAFRSPEPGSYVARQRVGPAPVGGVPPGT
jgi:AhpD family alkylhydroperoxidase